MAQRHTHAGRESATTRNPHSAAVPAAALTAKELAKLSPEQRVLSQWRAAFGCPISDEAKAQFCISVAGHSFRLSDVRLWQAHHPQRAGPTEDTGTIFLEFFFDGSPSELEGQQEAFTRAFEAMIEQELQERRVAEFRKRLAARRRRTTGAATEDAVDGVTADDEGWREYLQKPIPATELSIRSMREAGCMLRFLVCQTSLSVSASEALGQVAFQEHFPIDGVAQEPSKSTKPLPQWVYGMMACTAGLTAITLFAWWQVARQIALTGNDSLPGTWR